METISKIYLYNDPATTNLRLIDIKKYLKSKLRNPEVIIRNEFLNFHLTRNELANGNQKNDQTQQKEISELARKLVESKVRDLANPDKSIKPLVGEINFEVKHLEDPTKVIPGILYEGYKLHSLFQELLMENEIKSSICHIIFTPRLFGTFDTFDKRYHARVILCGYPSIISTTGIVEAPAKPKEYYKIKQNLLRQNITTIDEFIPEDLKQKYLKYNDPWLTEVLKGYAMQAIFYQVTNNPFCPEQYCRLFNAHWQEEVIQAQLTEPEFCYEHQELLQKLDKGC